MAFNFSGSFLRIQEKKKTRFLNKKASIKLPKKVTTPTQEGQEWKSSILPNWRHHQWSRCELPKSSFDKGKPVIRDLITWITPKNNKKKKNFFFFGGMSCLVSYLRELTRRKRGDRCRERWGRQQWCREGRGLALSLPSSSVWITGNRSLGCTKPL